METIRERLVYLFDKIGITRHAVAKRMGVSPQTIVNYCGGKYAPKTSFLDAFSKEYGISTEWLLSGTGPVFLKDKIGQFVSEAELERGAGHADPETPLAESGTMREDTESQAPEILQLEKKLLAVERRLLEAHVRVMTAVSLACREVGLSPNQSLVIQAAVMNYDNCQTQDQVREIVAKYVMSR